MIIGADASYSNVSREWLREEAQRLRTALLASESIKSGYLDENERLRAALKEIQAYSVGDPRPRHTWYYDRAEAALNPQQQGDASK